MLFQPVHDVGERPVSGSAVAERFVSTHVSVQLHQPLEISVNFIQKGIIDDPVTTHTHILSNGDITISQA